MSQEFFDAEAQQHASDLDIVRELRHSDASLYQLAHGRGARWQFNQLKSQLEEKDARIAELESSLRLLTLKAQSESEIQFLKQQLAEANKKLSWYQSGEIHTCHAECQRPFCVLHRQLESARGVISGYADGTAYKTNRQLRGEVLFDYAASSLPALQWLEENK